MHSKDNFCLFISPLIHDRAAKAYFQANKNGFGSDKKLGIIPLKHDQFCKILKLIPKIVLPHLQTNSINLDSF